MAPSELSNTAIADALAELGDLYELDGAIVHRVLAYRNAAKAVRESSVSVAALARAGRATELPGIGATLEQKIVTLLDTGTTPSTERMRAQFPAGLIAITRLPGLGPKRARLLFTELGIDSPQKLREAALAQRLRGVKGLGAKFEESVLASLDRMAAEPPERASGRLLLPKAIELGETLAAGLLERGGPGTHVQVAGSARRMTDSVKDIDLIAITTKPTTLAKTLARLPEIEHVSSASKPGAKARTHSGISVDLRIAKPAQLGNLLQHFTGSGPHNAALREAAVRSGLHVSEYGVLADGEQKPRTCASEEELYGLLGLDYIAPELREHRGELAGGRRRRAATADRAERHPRRSAFPHDRLRREELDRGDGPRRARARLRVPRDHRPLRLARLRRRGLPRAAAPPDRARARGERTAGGDRAAGGERGQHPARRLARLRGRAAR